MFFERSLSEAEISSALAKGEARAIGLLKEKSVETLKGKFSLVAAGLTACLENFDKELFLERENNQETDDSFKKMLLAAFSGVETLERVEHEIDQQKNCTMLIKESTNFHIALLKAVSVYKTNGESNIPSLSEQAVIDRYHHDHPQCAA